MFEAAMVRALTVGFFVPGLLLAVDADLLRLPAPFTSQAGEATKTDGDFSQGEFASLAKYGHELCEKSPHTASTHLERYPKFLKQIGVKRSPGKY